MSRTVCVILADGKCVHDIQRVCAKMKFAGSQAESGACHTEMAGRRLSFHPPVHSSGGFVAKHRLLLLCADFVSEVCQKEDEKVLQGSKPTLQVKSADKGIVATLLIIKPLSVCFQPL